MVNIIYQADKTIRFTQFDINATYDISDLKFFMPSDKIPIALYCVIKNENEEIDSIKLVSTSSDSKFYYCYKFSDSQPISHQSGKLTLFLFGVYEDKSTIISDEFNINLNVENFNITSQLYALSQISSEIANYYNKIEQLTKMNIELYRDMQELKTGGEI